MYAVRKAVQADALIVYFLVVYGFKRAKSGNPCGCFSVYSSSLYRIGLIDFTKCQSVWGGGTCLALTSVYFSPKLGINSKLNVLPCLYTTYQNLTLGPFYETVPQGKTRHACKSVLGVFISEQRRNVKRIGQWSMEIILLSVIYRKNWIVGYVRLYGRIFVVKRLLEPYCFLPKIVIFSIKHYIGLATCLNTFYKGLTLHSLTRPILQLKFHSFLWALLYWNELNWPKLNRVLMLFVGKRSNSSEADTALVTDAKLAK